MNRVDESILAKEKKEAMQTIGELLNNLQTSLTGLSHTESQKRILRYGHNQSVTQKEPIVIIGYLKKFITPLTLTLLAVSVLSYFLGQNFNAIIVMAMAVLSATLSFLQEYNASKTAKKLAELINIKTIVLRDGKKHEVLIKELVPGDVIELSAGKMVPADIRIITSNHFSVNQSVLTGESFPLDKQEKLTKKSYRSVFDMENLAFMGSSVSGGSATAVVIATGKQTEFGKLSLSLVSTRHQITSFDKGLRSFTYLMIRLIALLVLVIFATNALLKGNTIEGVLFSLAVAVGLTPEMLPMIVTINLSRGARDMAKKKVIIKELASIQNFGAMDILCTDKTGTITEDKIALQDHIDGDGKVSARVFELAYKNSSFQSGMSNVMDDAIRRHKRLNVDKIQKIYEIPFDFNRRIMSVIIKDKTKQLIAKGAPENIIHKSKYYNSGGKVILLSDQKRLALHHRYEKLSKEGYRVLAVAYKNVNAKKRYGLNDENEMVFAGFISFLDTPKHTSKEAIDKLENLGIKIKILTGDNEYVSRKICEEVKLELTGLLTSSDIDSMNDAQLRTAVEKANIFTRLTPNNKVRIIKILRSLGHTVGYMGDGINDSPSLRSADVGISVNNAADISKETAEIILLEKNLNILASCVVEGRKVFGNTVKYIKMGASSNFGNMISMVGASFFLPFLPMLPSQILLNNFLYDLSQISLPADNVDKDYIEKPKPWNIGFIKQFIFIIGPISSVFDFLTFGIMIWVFNASPSLFQTGWFVESLITQVLVIYVIRTNKIPFIESRPSMTLLLVTLSIVAIGALIPYTIIGRYFGFEPLPPLYFGILIFMSVAYLLAVQVTKTLLHKRFAD